jgi:hypothetical protein
MESSPRVAASLYSPGEVDRLLKSSLHADPYNYGVLGPDLDAMNIVIAAWVRLDPVETSSEAIDDTIRTIVSNKQGGCGAHNNGLSVAVNAWNSGDHRIHLEMGNGVNGCWKIDSGDAKLESGRWYHVAIGFDGDLALIFMDGRQIASGRLGLHDPPSTRPFSVGRFGDGQFPFYGNISHLAVVHPNADWSREENNPVAFIESLRDLHNAIPNVLGLQALYPMSDAASKTTVIARDVFHSINGKYTFSYESGAGLSSIFTDLVDGLSGRGEGVTSGMTERSFKESEGRRTAIRNGMKFVWAGYKTYAWGRDELKPLSKSGKDNWGGLGVTLVDSLDTLWFMGMTTEFWEGRDWVRDHLRFDQTGSVSVFETTIRELGGLLAAYDVSKDSVFLEKAKDLGNRLVKAFNTESGIPRSHVNLRSGEASNSWSGGNAILSELGSLQLEFRYLAESSGDIRFEQKSMKTFQVMHKNLPPSGLYPIKISIHDGSFADSLVTFGALGDSFYEYLLKLWLQGGRKEIWLRKMYDKAMNGVVKNLLKTSKPSGLAFLADWTGAATHLKMDHLVCFMPGTLALGAYTDPLGIDSARAQRDLRIAKALMYTCYQMYHRTKSGIAPEYVEFRGTQDFMIPAQVHFYILRPETAESLFVLHQLTEDPIYRDWSWEIWVHIDKHCKAGVGYGALRNVNDPGEGVDDRMESFFLGETLKYLYLIQDPSKPVDLMKVVLNTEAHPMSILKDDHEPVPEIFT